MAAKSPTITTSSQNVRRLGFGSLSLPGFGLGFSTLWGCIPDPSTGPERWRTEAALA